ncbi:hypothetical protein, partial [Stenotrophomonas rhizophila]|uniref:hypothetical protein n=1 Tax=Stenotrophomonas rhizophila TaxID=216778 RepID=UPI0028D74F6A
QRKTRANAGFFVEPVSRPTVVTYRFFGRPFGKKKQEQQRKTPAFAGVFVEPVSRPTVVIYRFLGMYRSVMVPS